MEKERLLIVAIVGVGLVGVEMVVMLVDLLFSWYVFMGGNINDLKIYLVNYVLGILVGDVNSGFKCCVLEEL